MWYVYAVASQRELQVKETLAELGFGVSVPMEIKMRKRAHSRRRVPKSEPLIRGYVFVNVPSDLGWWHILHMRHINSIVGMGGNPIAIDGNWLDSVSMKNDKKESRLNFEPGTRVEVVGGPAAGHLAKVIEASGEFASIYFENLGNLGNIKVRLEHLEQIN
jgi:transcription antitermination factor NusG